MTKKRLKNKFLIEQLEQRLLFSADFEPISLDSGGAVDTILVGSSVEEVTLFPSASGSHDTDSAEQKRQEILFVDSSISDYRQLVDDVLGRNDDGRSIDVVVLDINKDGILQISETLGNYKDLDAVHIVSHGDDGAIRLGNDWLMKETLDDYAPSIEGWQKALDSNADILFYGCNLAAGYEGLTLIENLSLLTGADVAASDDMTGSAERGGDWKLEYKKGGIETSIALSQNLQRAWDGTLATITVTSNADSGAGSLRQALIDAADYDTIAFNIGGGGPRTIQLNSSLMITNPVIIDGTSQPGFSGTPLIELDGTNITSPDPNGITLQAHNSTIKGLVINNSPDDGIEIEGNNNLIIGNFIGTDITGTIALPNRWGISVKGDNNVIGSSNPAERNIISGNTEWGIGIYLSANNTEIYGNYIGTDLTGMSALGNGGNGIEIYDSSTNTIIGGPGPGEGNLISANGLWGIEIIGNGTDDTIIQGNLIGVAITGTATIDMSNADGGIRNKGSAGNTIIGGTGPGEGNTIAAMKPGAEGVHLSGGSNISIRGNDIFNTDGGGIVIEAGVNGNVTPLTLTSATFDGADLTANATYMQPPGEILTVDFYVNTSPIPGQGSVYIGSGTINTDASGSFSLTITPINPVAVGDYIITTVTDSLNQTSTYSNNIQAAAPGNNAPSISLTNVVNSLAENTDTTSSVKVADIVITDIDGGINNLSLSGDDTGHFLIAGTELHLKAGIVMDFESPSDFDSDNVYDVTVEVDDPGLSGMPEDSASFSLTVIDSTVQDNFDVQSYSNNDGPSNWSGPWTETDNNNVTNGLIRVTAGGRLQFGTNNEDDFTGIQLVRQANFAGATEAALSYTYQRQNADDGDGKVRVQISSDGSTWTTVKRHNLAGNDAAEKYQSIDISSFLTPAGDIYVRFKGVGDDVDGKLSIDNVKIEDVSAGNSPPAIISDGGMDDAFLSIPENTTDVTTVTAIDSDGDPLTFSISGGADKDLFTLTPIDPNNVQLEFLAPPDFELPSDSDLDNTYEVEVSVFDGTIYTTQLIEVTVTNDNDAPVIGGTDTGIVTEDADPDLDGLLETSGTMTISDEDSGEDQFAAGIVNGTYGSITIDTAGNWSYAADNTQAAIQQLGAGDSITDTISVATEDGTSHDIVITINGANDTPVIGGVDTGSVTEDVDPDSDGLLETSGTMTISDTESGEDQFTSATIVGTYGSLIIDNAGNWSYAADSTQAAIQQLGAGDSITDTISVATEDGTSHDIVITINGANDAPVIGGVDTGSVTEDADPDLDGLLETSNALTITDADAGENQFTPTTYIGSNGSLTINTIGQWSYEADNTQAAIQQLGAGESISDTFTVDSADGTTHDIIITIYGSNDIPVIGGVDTGSVTEDVDPDLDGLLETSGTITITDTDSGEDQFSSGTVTGMYGSLTIDATGNWTYEADNTQPAIQTLDPGDSLIDTVSVTTEDGTSHDINITIHGANAAPTVIKLTKSSVNENDAGAVIGNLLTTDPDPGDSHTYTVNDARFEVAGNKLKLKANQNLDHESEPLVDITVTSTDSGGLSIKQTFSITVINVNEAPTGTNLNAPETFSTGTPLNLTDIVVFDVDSATVTVKLKLSDPAAGTLSTGKSGVVKSTYNPATGVWKARGAIADVNALLAGVVFTPDDSFDNDFTITAIVKDGKVHKITGIKNMTFIPVIDPPSDPGPVEELPEPEPEAPEEPAEDIIPDDPLKTIGSGDEGRGNDPLRDPAEKKTSVSVKAEGIIGSIAEKARANLRLIINDISSAYSALPFDLLSIDPAQELFVQEIFNDELLIKTYNRMRSSLDMLKEETSQEIQFDKMVVGSTIAASTGLSVGYVIWLIRSGMLLTSVLASMPAWQIADPLPILSSMRGDDDDDDESLEEILKKSEQNDDKYKKAKDNRED